MNQQKTKYRIEKDIREEQLAGTEYMRIFAFQGSYQIDLEPQF